MAEGEVPRKPAWRGGMVSGDRDVVGMGRTDCRRWRFRLRDTRFQI